MTDATRISESSQIHYAGLEGWNDLKIDLQSADKRSKEQRRPRRVFSDVNLLQEQPIPRQPTSVLSLSELGVRGPASPAEAVRRCPPPVSRGSTPLQCPKRATPPPPAAKQPTTTTPPLASNTTDTKPEITNDEVKSLIANLHKQNSTPQTAQAASRVENALPTLPAPHLQFISDVVGKSSNNKSEAVKSIVEYCISNSNVSSWAIPLRRLIEQCI